MRNMNKLGLVFFIAVAATSCSAEVLKANDVAGVERPSVTSISIEKVDLEHMLQRRDDQEEHKDTQDKSRNLQQYMPYCRDINIHIECTNMKTGKDCRQDVVPYNRNSCYLYLKYKIAVTNSGTSNAAIRGLSRQQNGSEKSFMRMIRDGFILKPSHKITISRTEWLNYCEVSVIGTGAEVLADVSEQTTCANHDFYIIGDE